METPDLFHPAAQREWEILNANNVRWGDETYSSKEAAEAELKAFWKGVSGVRLNKFTIREVPGE